MVSSEEEEIVVFRNCRLLRSHAIVKEDLWVRKGKIIDPEPLFYLERRTYTKQVDCQGALIAPGLIDIQINGAFGVDFTRDVKDAKTAEECLRKVGVGLLSHGVTSYCPTVVTSSSDNYRRVLPHLGPSPGGPDCGAEILGAHLEGPFISRVKKGAHKEEHIYDFDSKGALSVGAVEQMYGGEGFYETTAIVTMAPELDPDGQVIKALSSRGVAVSVGHSVSTLEQGELAVRSGARLITHLFNAMLSFHHRDPGLIGLLTSTKLGGNDVFYGIIADGIHTHMAALRVAYRTNFASLVLVTDAIVAMGLSDGTYTLGEQVTEVTGDRALVAGTNTLCGAIATLWRGIQKLIKGARCSIVEALEAATLHPAQALGVDCRIGTLDFDTEADFIMIDVDRMEIMSTWIAGRSVYEQK